MPLLSVLRVGSDSLLHFTSFQAVMDTFLNTVTFFLFKGRIRYPRAVWIPVGLVDCTGEKGARSFCFVQKDSAERHLGHAGAHFCRGSSGKFP